MTSTPLSKTSCPTSILHQNLRVNYSVPSNPQLNFSSSPHIHRIGLAVSCFTMLFGTISNLTALAILAKARFQFRGQSKAPFLLLTVALLLADLGGHVLLGTFALCLHIGQIYEIEALKPTEELCLVFGTSMVFFGLCPLLYGCAMAVERCVAITHPFFHNSMITVAHVWLVLLFLSSLAMALAVLPFFGVGTYTAQFPRTWCFLPIHNPGSTADTYLALTFSCLGLTALALSVLCNIQSGLVLLQAKMKSRSVKASRTSQYTHRISSGSSSSLFCSLDVEMMVQLAVITVVSCVCWSPFLIHILVMLIKQCPSPSDQTEDRFILLGLRMASWNQILDPWVYILLRRTVLFRVFFHRDSH
ncbi:prostaglandin E receptor 1c (subtype EP1) isoform 2-T2 [Pholidichthys leucotaenia]